VKKLALVLVALVVVGAIAVGCVPPSEEAVSNDKCMMVIMYSGGVPVKVWENISNYGTGQSWVEFTDCNGNRLFSTSGTEVLFIEFIPSNREQILKEYGLIPAKLSDETKPAESFTP